MLPNNEWLHDYDRAPKAWHRKGTELGMGYGVEEGYVHKICETAFIRASHALIAFNMSDMNN